MTGKRDEPHGRGVKIVRRRLADGTIKTYRYNRAVMRPRAPQGDLRQIFNEYSRSPEFKRLAPAWQARKLWLYRMIEKEIGWMTMADLEARTARADFYALRDKHAHLPHRADKMMQSLSSALAWAYDRGTLDVNHAARIKPLIDWKRSPRRDIIYTEEHEELLLAKLPDDMRRLYLFALYTGLRRADIAALPPSAIHRDGWLVCTPEKTSRSTAVEVHLPVFALPPLAALIAEMPKHPARLLATATCVPWTVTNISVRWRRQIGAIGLDGMVFNDIRGTTASRLVAAGCTEAERGIVMGHALATGAGRVYVARTRELALNAYKRWNTYLTRGAEIVALENFRQ